MRMPPESRTTPNAPQCQRRQRLQLQGIIYLDMAEENSTDYKSRGRSTRQARVVIPQTGKEKKKEKSHYPQLRFAMLPQR